MNFRAILVVELCYKSRCPSYWHSWASSGIFSSWNCVSL